MNGLVPFLSAWNEHNIVNWLHSNIKLKLKQKISSLEFVFSHGGIWQILANLAVILKDRIYHRHLEMKYYFQNIHASLKEIQMIEEQAKFYPE